MELKSIIMTPQEQVAEVVLILLVLVLNCLQVNFP
jgi:hypothetical protein